MNANGRKITTSDNVVTWSYGLAAYMKRPSIDLVVRYAAAPAAH